MAVHLTKISTENKEEVLPFFHLLDESQKEMVNNNLNSISYQKKDIIFRQNTRSSHLVYIKSGLVKIFKEGKGGRIIILKIARAGDYIGLMSLFGDDLHQYSASALEDTAICDIDFLIIKSIIQENGKFSMTFLKTLSKDGLFVFERLMGQSHKQLPGRVADVLLYFSEVVYKSTTFSIPLTRKELADFSGTTKESFIRTLTEFKNDKIINIEGSEVSINSMDIIRTLSLLG